MKEINPVLEHILRAISRIERFTKDYDFSKFKADDKTSEAVIRQIEIIGESTIHLEDDFKHLYPSIPWQDIKDMRNHLIHEYWDVNLEDVWETIQKDIPVLKKFIESLLVKQISSD